MIDVNNGGANRTDRLLPAVPFPAYTYVPGRRPHPLRDPQGHSYGIDVVVEQFDPNTWRSCEAYLRAIDLFNAGYYWEAHEHWEAVWNAVGRRGPLADFIKGLIKLAAAGVKVLESRPIGIQRHAARAAQLFADSSQPTTLGLDVATLRRFANDLSTDYELCEERGMNDEVRPVWEFRLRLVVA